MRYRGENNRYEEELYGCMIVKLEHFGLSFLPLKVDE